jgi:hypothetical protein
MKTLAQLKTELTEVENELKTFSDQGIDVDDTDNERVNILLNDMWHLQEEVMMEEMYAEEEVA